MSLYDSTIPQYKKMLQNMHKLLLAAEAHAKKKNFDVNVLIQARLAPDQYPFVRQVQSACDSAKYAAARLTGKEAPSHPDTEQTFEELHARIRKVTSYIEEIPRKDFEGAETREIALPFLEGKKLAGKDYVNELTLPNFYFHAVTAYAILRHNGVELGKTDYIGSLSVK